MHIRTRIAAGALAALAAAGGAAGTAAAQTTPHAPGQLTFTSQLTAIQFFTVSFDRDVLCQDIIILNGQGDLQASWTVQWPATGTRGPASFDGVIDGGTAHFAAAHGTFHAATLPGGGVQITAVLSAGQR